MSQLNVGIVNSTGGVQLPSFTTANLPVNGISAGFLAYDSTESQVKFGMDPNGENLRKLV